MSLYGTDNDTGLPRENTPHKEYKFLCSNGMLRHWTHCPLCDSTNDGHSPDGSPRYDGGTILVERNGYETLYACLCEEGERRQRMGMASMARANNVTFKTQPLIIVWRRGDAGDIPPESEPIDPEVVVQLINLTNDMLAGKINNAQFIQKRDEIEAGVPTMATLPKMEDILNNKRMLDVYMGVAHGTERTPYKEA